MQLLVDIPSSKASFALDVLNLSSQVEELYGIFEGIRVPDKKDIRKAMYESNR